MSTLRTSSDTFNLPLDNLRRLWRFLRPTSREGWGVFGALILLFIVVIPPGLKSPAGALAALFLLALGAVAVFLPIEQRALWSQAPWPVRGFLLLVFGYVSVVSIGAGPDIRSLRHLTDYLCLLNGAPLTLSHGAGALLAVALFVRQKHLIQLWRIPQDPEPEIIDGRKLITQEEVAKIGSDLARKSIAKRAAEAAERKLPQPGPDDFICWGNTTLPIECATKHLGIVGTSGSGKTTVLLLFLKSILPNIKPGMNRRALIYDAKREIMSVLTGIKTHCPVVTIHPFDKRGVAWDLAKDINDPATATEIATVLIPEYGQGDKDRFFVEAARALSSGVMEAFMHHCPGEWTLRDVVLSFRSRARLQTILSLGADEEYEGTRHLYDEYVGKNETSFGILAEIANVLRRLAFVASAWDVSRAEKFSLQRDFVESECILVLGRDPTQESTLKQLNGIIVKRLSQLLLAQDDVEKVRLTKAPPITWMIIDEFRAAGKLDGVKELLVEGRSKGIAGVIGFQDFPGLQEEYGDKVAEELFGLCNSKAFLRLGENTSDEYASRYFGDQTLKIVNYLPNENITFESRDRKSQYSTGWSTNVTREKRRLFEAGHFLKLPEADFNGFGIVGYFDTIGLPDAYKMHLRGPLKDIVPQPNSDVPNFDPRDPNMQRLRRWTEEDLKRLKLTAFVELLGDDPEDARPAGEELPPFDFDD